MLLLGNKMPPPRGSDLPAQRPPRRVQGRTCGPWGDRPRCLWRGKDTVSASWKQSPCPCPAMAPPLRGPQGSTASPARTRRPCSLNGPKGSTPGAGPHRHNRTAPRARPEPPWPGCSRQGGRSRPLRDATPPPARLDRKSRADTGQAFLARRNHPDMRKGRRIPCPGPRNPFRPPRAPRAGPAPLPITAPCAGSTPSAARRGPN
jgi:hypothetical protein